jgi:hypothetical protein
VRQTISLIFVFIKNLFHPILIFFILAEVFLWVGNPRSCAGAFFGKEGREQVLAGPVPSSQILGSLLKTNWPALPAGKIQRKVSSINSLQCKNIK